MKRASWLLLIPVLLFSLFTTNIAQAQQRRGWSPQGKGAAIGGAAGILGGALLDRHNRAVGGLIGGAVGAGAGYAVGKHIDNKHKKAAALAAERAAANEHIADANARAAAAEHTAAEERRAAAEHRAAARPALGVATAAVAGAAAAQAFAPATAPSTLVAAGYLPNPQYGQADTAYPNSPVLRKSW